MQQFPPTEFSSERLIFRQRAVNQAKELYALIDSNRDHLNTWMPWVEKTTEVNHTIQYIEMIAGQWDQRKTFDYSVFDKATNKLIGSFGLHTIDWNNKKCELGYWIDSKFEGKGLISEAIKAFEEKSRELEFHRLGITCNTKNIRSSASAVRNGYILEGRFFDDILDRGKWRGTLQYVKLLNPIVEGQITENFPHGFSFKECTSEEFGKYTDGLFEIVYDDVELILRPSDVTTAEEKEKLKRLNENFKYAYRFHAILLYEGKTAGWTWGYQDSRESFYMVNSAIMPEFRRQGLYSRILEITMKKLIEKGYQKIWSRHDILNNDVIIPKLKYGFKITGTEINDTFGCLTHLAYYTNPLRRKVMQFRSGSLRPDDEIKKILKI